MLTTRVQRHTAQGLVLYDGECPFCRKSVAILKRLDWAKQLAYQSCRETDRLPKTDPPLSVDRIVEEMHLVTPEGDIHAGFKAFRWIAGRLPMLWAFVPLMYVPGIPTLGQKLYLWIAKNRFNLIPCHDGVCQIPLKKPAK